MKKYFIFIAISLIILLTTLIIAPKITKSLNNKNLNNIKNSIVSITKKEKLKLINEQYWLKNEKIKNIWNTKQKWKWFFINNNWYIITNKHIINSYTWTYEVNYKSKLYNAKVIKIYKNKDLSIIKINIQNQNFLNIETKPNLYTWEKIFAFINNNFLDWIILDKNIKLNNNTTDIISTNLKLKPWDSWTPLFNSSNNVIWINTAIWNNNLSYATLITKKELWY